MPIDPFVAPHCWIHRWGAGALWRVARGGERPRTVTVSSLQLRHRRIGGTVS